VLDPKELLLPYQKAWLQDESPVKLAVKSRRIGLTFAEAFDAVLIAAANTGQNYYYISVREELGKEFIETTIGIATALNIAFEQCIERIINDEKEDCLALIIRMASGHKVMALTSKPSNLRGLQGVICIDEAAFHNSLKELWKAAAAMRIWGSKIRLISTHNGENSEFNQMLIAAKSGEFPASVHEIDLNAALNQGLYQRICQKQNIPWTFEGQEEWKQKLIKEYGDTADEELFCIPSNSSRSYFTRQLITDVMTDDYQVFRYYGDTKETNVKAITQSLQDFWFSQVRPYLQKFKANYESWLGVDFGRFSNHTVISILFNTIKKEKFCPLIIELSNVPHESQRDFIATLIRFLTNFRKGSFDATGSGEYLAESIRYEFGNDKINAVKITAQWYQLNYPRYKSAIEGRLFNLPWDEDLIQDHLSVVLENGTPKTPRGYSAKGLDGNTRHGDGAVSLVLMYSGVPDDWTTKSKRRTMVSLSYSPFN